jgi:hypothetical protein
MRVSTPFCEQVTCDVEVLQRQAGTVENGDRICRSAPWASAEEDITQRRDVQTWSRMLKLTNAPSLFRQIAE